MKSIVRFVAQCVLVLATICNVDASHAADKLVVVLPLTGKLANIGSDLRNAISLQETGSVDVSYDDDMFDPRHTVTIVEKSLANPNVKGFIFFGSGTALAAKSIIERARKPAVAIAMSDKIVEGTSFLFRYYIPIHEQADRIKEEMARRGYKKVVFVVSQQEAMLGFQSYFRDALPNTHNFYLEVPPGDVDLRGVALKALSMAPDAIGLLLLPPELSTFAKQARALGFKGEFFGPTQLGNVDAVKAASSALENAWFTGIDEVPARALIGQYQNKFGLVPTSEAIAAYDAVGLLAAAIQTSDAVQFLKQPHSFHGVFGSALTFVSPNTFKPPLALKHIRGLSLVQ